MHQHNGLNNIRFIVSQAKHIYRYKSLKTKILKCNANIFFNKQYLNKNVTPKYADIKVANTSKKTNCCVLTDTRNEILFCSSSTSFL
jgi:hypothetical protein